MMTLTPATFRTRTKSLFFAALVALVALLSSPVARAAGGPARPHIVLHVPNGGPLVLHPGDGGFVGTFEIANDGAGPLVISRVSVRGDEDEPRSPRQVTAHFANGAPKSLTLAQGQAVTVDVAWMPERNARARELFGHIVVTSNDEHEGEVAVGIRARLPRGPAFLVDHVVSIVVFLPLVGAFVLAVLLFAGVRNDAVARLVALATTGLETVFAAWVYTRFDGELSRLDGNDGLQFVEHAVWVRALRSEYFVGIDGIGLPLVLLASLVAFAGVIASYARPRDVATFFIPYLVLTTGIVGVFVAMDLLLFLVFWQVAIGAAYVMVAAFGGPDQAARAQAATKLVLVTTLGAAFLLVAFVALHVHSDRTFLVDGTITERSWSIPELMRVSYGTKNLVLFGMPFVKVVFVFAFLGFAVMIPMAPLHTWFPDAHAEAPAGVAALLASGFVAMGAFGIVRVLVPILPEATRWAAGAIVALGVVSILYGGLCALVQDDAKRLVAYGVTSHGGFALVGIGALTPQGITGAIVELATHGAIAALVTLLVAGLEDRVATRAIHRFGGLASESPVTGFALAIGLLASLGLPGLAGFWGEVLAIVGVFPTFQTMAAIAALGTLLVASGYVVAMQRLLFGVFPETLRSHRFLEPFGGRFPDLSFREMAAVAPLVVVIVLLGVWPSPLFRVLSGSVRDVTSFVNPPGPDQIAFVATPARASLAVR